jgi:hypothetical protein
MIVQSDAPIWCAAMQCEINSLEEQGVFECTTLPAGQKAIGCCWVYAYKYNPDGSIIRGKEKARLVAQGFSQRPEDYGSTYAPVAKMTSIRIVLAHAAHHDWEIFSFNVKTVFLHAALTILIYLKQILTLFFVSVVPFMVFVRLPLNSTLSYAGYYLGLVFLAAKLITLSFGVVGPHHQTHLFKCHLMDVILNLLFQFTLMMNW